MYNLSDNNFRGFSGSGFIGILKESSVVGWLLLLRPVLSLLFSRQRDLASYSSIDATAVIFIIYSFLAFIYSFHVLFKSRHAGFCRTVLKRSPISWFVLYMAIAVISMFWSVNPILTGYRAFECIAMMFLVIAVIVELFDRGGFDYFARWTLVYVTWDILFSILRTMQWAQTIDSYWQSSQMMATTFFFLALYNTPKSWRNYLIMLMSVLSMSTVSYIGMAVGSISAFWGNAKSRLIALACFFLMAVIVAVVGPYRFFKETLFFDKEDISMEQTSGRDYLMEVTIQTLYEHPGGLGFFAGEPYVLYQRNLHAISAHNSFFSAGMGMGVLGIVSFSLFIIALFKTCFSKYIDKRYRSVVIGCFFVAFLHCLGNPSVGTRVYGAWVPGMYVFVMASVVYVRGKYYGNGYKSVFMK